MVEKKDLLNFFGKRINLDDVQEIISGYGLESVYTGDDILIKVGCVGISPRRPKFSKKINVKNWVYPILLSKFTN